MPRVVVKNYVVHNGEQFHERASRDAYDLALSLMARLPPRMAAGLPAALPAEKGAGRGRAIDLAAGSGYTSRRLSELGFAVTAYDIFTDQFVPRDIPIKKADLNQHIDEPDGSVDAVMALEVIEHLENPRAFLREIARVLREGGGLVLSTPNIVTLGSKLRFAFREELELFFNDVTRTRDSICAEASGHISPLLPWLLQIFVKDAGLTILETAYTKRWGMRTKHLGRSAILAIEKQSVSSSQVVERSSVLPPGALRRSG